MSRLSEYSKFDNLDSSDEEEERTSGPQSSESTQLKAPAGTPREGQQCLRACYKHNPETERFTFIYANKSIYEWEQHLSDVVLYVPAPPNIPAKQIKCTILPSNLALGLVGVSRPFIDEQPYHTIDASESTWVMEDGKIVIYLQKAQQGIVWGAALKGRFDAKLNQLDLGKVQKDLMLERWQLEHPGMDFRDADFNGSVPDPRTFMGGISYE